MAMTYRVTLNNLDSTKYLEIWEWCEEHIGPVWKDRHDIHYRWSLIMTGLISTVIFCFEYEDDATLFKLRWG